jgi:hypothetical protein
MMPYPIEIPSNWNAKARPRGPDLAVGDLVMHKNEASADRIAEVTGFGPAPDKWVCVRTWKGKYRTWARQNLIRLDSESVTESGLSAGNKSS